MVHRITSSAPHRPHAKMAMKYSSWSGWKLNAGSASTRRKKRVRKLDDGISMSSTTNEAMQFPRYSEKSNDAGFTRLWNLRS